MGTISEIGQIGRTRLWTRFEVRLRVVAAFLALLGAAAAAAIGAAVVATVTGLDQVWPVINWVGFKAGDGPLLDPTGASTSHLQFPVDVTLPPLDPWWPALLVAVPLFALWMRYVVNGLVLGRFTGNLRHQGLATARSVRKRFSRHTVRKEWRHALPTSTRLRRLLVGTPAMGIYLGRAKTPAKGGHLWADLEQRVRIVAPPGWGKTRRVLIPVIRQLHGPVLISSTEPEIFTATVQARACRRTPGRFGYRHPEHMYPVAVIDCSPDRRITGGKYGAATWNPIPGCENFVIATRRAEALVKGVDGDEGGNDSTSRWFEDGASKILAAWFHAAALNPALEIENMAKWLSTSKYDVPRRILQEHATDPAALTGMNKYLDPKGGRTTSNLETSVARALYSLTSVEGRAVCGLRSDPGQLDMAKLIRDQGTMYLLGEPDRMRVIRPLLSMIAAEMFQAAEDVARLADGSAPAFYAVLDELRSGVRVATLPDIASEKRKFRIGYLYACTNGGDEAALYGDADAARLKAAAGVSIYGGLDEQSVDDITNRAGETSVVTASRGGIAGNRQESIHQHDVLTAADMQQLDDGESVFVARRLLPFLAFTPALHEMGSMRRAVKREGRLLEQRAVRA